MTELSFTARFRRDYRELPAATQDLLDRKLAVLQDNPRHPSLRLKRIRGTAAIWEVSVNMQVRMTLMFESDDHIILRRVGTHKVLADP